MSKNYAKYLPKKDSQKRLVQAHIDDELHAQVKAILEKEGWTWTDLITGLLTKFIDETKPRKAV